MRLWHEDLIPALPRQQLLGQHRECCALRGKGWGRKHATVQYVFNYSPSKLFQYHVKIMDEMKQRGYRPDSLWEEPTYRGKNSTADGMIGPQIVALTEPIYPEHDEEYLEECLQNLRDKDIFL